MLSDDELEIFESAKLSNPWYFRALVMGAKVMLDRRRKYSGSGDPYSNFMIVARIRNKKVEDVLADDVALKMGRMEMRSGDFPDESELDTLRDLGNYSFLWLGWRIRVLEEQNEDDRQADDEGYTPAV